MRNPHKPIDIAYVFALCTHASRPRIDLANSAGSSVRGNRWPYTSSVIVMEACPSSAWTQLFRLARRVSIKNATALRERLPFSRL